MKADVDRDGQVAADLAALTVLAARLAETEQHRQRLLDERNALYVKLLDAGVPQAQIGRAAGRSSMSVALAADKARKAAHG